MNEGCYVTKDGYYDNWDDLMTATEQRPSFAILPVDFRTRVTSSRLGILALRMLGKRAGSTAAPTPTDI